MKEAAWIVILLVGCVLGLLSFCDYIENPRSYFTTYNDAKASGMMAAGWIPTYIPYSSTEISETHDIDTNTVKMTFKYSLNDTAEIEKNCTQIMNSAASTKQYRCTYYGNEVIIELRSDGSGSLESYRR